MSKVIENGRIVKTMLGIEDHGIFTFYLHVEMASGNCAYGGYALDAWSDQLRKRVGWDLGIQVISDLMECLGVERWEDLTGTYLRCEHEGWGGRMTRVGHLIKDQWFSMEAYVEEEERE